ncbi:MAG: helix-turn-helix transcriptional regulator [Lachnospiraceae bacterium]|nr:helix-turn-helix transcriptional regulator [Lachnospiraceae bacterium]
MLVTTINTQGVLNHMKNDTSYLAEQITHRTLSRPFLIHHTTVTNDMKLALYLHYHSEMEFFYLTEGEVDFVIEEETFRLKEGDAIFIPPGLIHYADNIPLNDKTCSFHALVFDISLLTDVLPSYCKHYIYPARYNARKSVLHINSSTDCHTQILELLCPIFDMDKSDIDTYELELRGRLLMIWQLMYNTHLNSVHNNSLYDHIYPQLKKSIDYLDNNYQENIELSTLAYTAGMSEGHFCRIFKEFTGFTPFTYLNRKRILESCRYLTDSTESIADIATKCGYNNISYYNRTFLKMMHETPSAYRKRTS